MSYFHEDKITSNVLRIREVRRRQIWEEMSEPILLDASALRSFHF